MAHDSASRAPVVQLGLINHHVRNGLQAIVLRMYISEDVEAARDVCRYVEEIEHVMKDIAPVAESGLLLRQDILGHKSSVPAAKVV
jgi:hypothetical protein